MSQLKNNGLLMLVTASMFLTACAKSGSGSSSPSAVTQSSVAVVKASAITDGIALGVPQFAMAHVPVTFALSLPSGVTVSNVSWNLGDGTLQSGAGPINYTYLTTGAMNVSVSASDSLGNNITLNQTVNVLAYNESYACISSLGINVPASGTTGQPVSTSVSVPQCMSFYVASIQWSFGDSSSTASGSSATHTYTTAGDYTVTATITMTYGTVFTLTAPISEASPDPAQCPTAGATQQLTGAAYSQAAACGVNGTEYDQYQNITTQTCQSVGGILKWVDTSVVPQLVSRGACTAQACALPPTALTGVSAIAQGIILINGVYYMTDGSSLTFYSSQSPADACSTVAQSRQCNNGVLSGGINYSYLYCANGCPGFGPDGTVNPGVVIGTQQVPKSCPNGTTVYDVYGQLADQSCQNGQVQSSNSREGSLVSAGQCAPIVTYSWTATGNYTACSADCGGTQSVVYECRDSNNQVVSGSLCAGAPPTASRVCDGNPAAVAHSDVSTSTESTAGSCPAHQTGLVSSIRTVTTTTSVACVNHAVATSAATSDGPWTNTAYCVDYNGLSCQKEHLNDKQAGGRYDWMVKCQANIPVVQEFLTKFANVHVMVDGQSIGLGDKGRVLYPTFGYKVTACDCSDHDSHGDDWDDGEWENSDHGRHLGECTKADKDDSDQHGTCSKHEHKRSCQTVTITRFWHAPVESSSVCKAPPSGVFVSGVCVSSGKGGGCGDHDDGRDDDHG